MNIRYFNAQSIVNKLVHLEFLFANLSPDIILITETWLHDNIPDSLLNFNGKFNIIRQDRKSKGGGVSILINRALIYLPVHVNKVKYVEIVCVDILGTDSNKLRIIVVYLPPKYVLSTQIITALLNELSILCAIEHDFIIGGDFNMSCLKWNDADRSLKNETGKMILDFCFSNEIIQHINFPTRGVNILDLLLTKSSTKLQNITMLPPIDKSDHNQISFQYTIPQDIKQ